jgi:hypothetical protein
MKLVVSPKFVAVNKEPWRLYASKANTNILTEEFCLLGYNTMLSKLCLLLPLSPWFLARLILRPWSWRGYVPPKRRLTFNVLHRVISQEIEIFIATAVRTSNPTLWLKFLWIPQANAGIIYSVRPPPLPYTFFPIQYSLFSTRLTLYGLIYWQCC